MCGLKNKLLIPEFIDTVSKNDIFACTETHLDKYDVVTIDGYAFFSKHRRQKTLRKSGGIGIFMKSSIATHCEIIDTDCEYIQWCKLSKSVYNSDGDLLIGVVYIPPENTRFFKQSLIDQFYLELESMCSIYENVLVISMPGQEDLVMLFVKMIIFLISLILILVIMMHMLKLRNITFLTVQEYHKIVYVTELVDSLQIIVKLITLSYLMVDVSMIEHLVNSPAIQALL